MKISYYSLVLIFSVMLWGCSNGNSSSPAVSAALDTATGKHAAGWANSQNGGLHVAAYFSNQAGCKECHGNPAELSGGIVKVSCSSVSRNGIACHAGKWPHGPGYEAYTLHGNSAMAAASGTSGMASCRQCHGVAYQGNVGPSCIACHKTSDGSNAPHPSNWRTGANNNSLKHSSTDISNADACAQCHLGGTYSHPAPTPAPKGTAPGCFNGTLCHNNAGHAPYTAVTHQPPARDNVVCGIACHAIPATATSNPRFNVPIVTTNGTPMSNGCETCHTRPGLAHPYMWLPNRGSSATHGAIAADGSAVPIPGNILGACVTCHNVTTTTAKFGVPSCMAGSPGVAGITCHFSSPVLTTGVSVGCRSCHGDATTSSPTGTTAPNRDNKHSAHFSTGLTCSTVNCHTGFGPPLATHSNGSVNLAYDNVKFGEGTGIVYTAGTGCTNVACHGGKATPPWNTASYTPDYVYDPSGANCTINCHGVPNTDGNTGGQYINAYNGNNVPYGSLVSANLHYGHVYNVNPPFVTPCTDCHGIPSLQANHFAQLYLGQRLFVAGDPQATGYATSTLTGTRIFSYSGAKGTCYNNCHDPFGFPGGTPGDARDWFQ